MIYVIQAENGFIKIGCSNFPTTRFSGIQFNSPLQLRLIAIFLGDKRDEHALHARFDSSRRHNEWFAPDEDILRFCNAVWGRGLDCAVSEWITDFKIIRTTRREAFLRRLSERAKESWARRAKTIERLRPDSSTEAA